MNNNFYKNNLNMVFHIFLIVLVLLIISDIFYFSKDNVGFAWEEVEQNEITSSRKNGVKEEISYIASEELSSIKSHIIDAIDNQDYEQIVKYAKKMIELKPDEIAGYVALGYGYYMLMEPTKALNAYAKAMELEPRNPKIYYGIGSVYYRSGDYKKAAEYYEWTVKFDNNHIDALNALAFTYKELGRIDDGKNTIEKAERLAKEDLTKVYASKGKYYFEIKDYDEALRQYNKAFGLAESPDYIRYRFAKIYYKMQNYKKSLEEYKKIIQIYPSDPFPYYAIGEIYSKLKKPKLSRKYMDKAREKYEAILKEYPKNDATKIALASLLVEQKIEPESGFKLANELLASVHYKGYSKAIIGVYYYQKKQYDTARPYLKEALVEIPPDEKESIALICYYLGLNEYELGDFTQAYNYLSRALKLDPNFDEEAKVKKLLKDLEDKIAKEPLIPMTHSEKEPKKN